MNDQEVGEFWNANAAAWMALTRVGYTLSQWLNMLGSVGFALEHMEEPRPSEKQVSVNPRLQDASVVAYFLHIRARKPSNRYWKYK